MDGRQGTIPTSHRQQLHIERLRQKKKKKKKKAAYPFRGLSSIAIVG